MNGLELPLRGAKKQWKGHLAVKVRRVHIDLSAGSVPRPLDLRLATPCNFGCPRMAQLVSFDHSTTARAKG